MTAPELANLFAELAARHDDLLDEVRALTWEVCRMREGARHLAGDPDARATMPALPRLKAVYVAEHSPKVEFRDTTPAAPLTEAP